MPASASEPVAQRLRGTVQGRDRVFLLDAREHRVGSAESNDIYLPVLGVSRHHALLRPTPDGWIVRDLGSRNGTFVDQLRVECAEVPLGTEICFGPARLEVESVAAGDAELALELEPEARDPAAALEGHGEETIELWLGRAGDPPSWRSASGVRRWVGGAQREQPRCAAELTFPDGFLPGRSPAAVALYRQLRQLLRGEMAVLLVGETGVGKEQIARTLHASSARRRGPFVAVNCAAIPAEMLEAEMFGVGRAVATGVDERRGNFQLAAGGTLFLDEIGELSPPLQAKLLRALQEREVKPVGDRPRAVDVRVVAATNADLLRRMEDGTFRPDLFYRLAAHLVELPPLRRCRDDIPALVEHFLRRAARDVGVRLRGVTARALQLLVDYPWPGNVRELEHEMHRLACAAIDDQIVDSRLLTERIRRPPFKADTVKEPQVRGSLALEPQLRALEEHLIREALNRTDGKQVEAARLLGISRNGLAKKIRRLGIRGQGVAASSSEPGWRSN